jgi:hypothetical protein
LAKHAGELPDEMALHPVNALRDEFSETTAQELMQRALGLPEVSPYSPTISLINSCCDAAASWSPGFGVDATVTYFPQGTIR